jgi:hypothetical protein
LVVALAVVVIAVVLAFFAVDTIGNDLGSFIAIVLIAVGAIVLDALFRHPPPGQLAAEAPG